MGLFTASTWASATLNSGDFTAMYLEPTLSEDGALLHDLAYTSIYYRLDGGNRHLVMQVPASNVAGGGRVEETFTISGLGGQVDVEIVYTATDLLGNESTTEYKEAVIRIDKVAPNAPQGE